MAKYLRTKDGIYDYLDFKIDFNEVIETGFTIEELCDNFIVEYEYGRHPITLFYDFYHLQKHRELYNQDYYHVAGRYGGIWVPGKGLIYVAKMNEKGELELL